MVNYTLGDEAAKLKEFKVRSATGEVCITSSLDYETRNVYEFPVIATDRGKSFLTRIKLDSNITKHLLIQYCLCIQIDDFVTNSHML